MLKSNLLIIILFISVNLDASSIKNHQSKKTDRTVSLQMV